MRYYIIAGEASGDLHGSNLVKAIRTLDADAQIRCWGGDMMRSAGAELVKHYTDLAFMGFAEVISNLPTILNNLSFCKKDILKFAPDVLVLIDYPGFNLRIAKWAKKNGLKTAYYVSPQIWAWKQNRVHLIKKVVDRMIVILPFEKDFYSKFDYQVQYVGHPLVEVVEEYAQTKTSGLKTMAAPKSGETQSAERQKVIALIPGSRRQEIETKLPVMLEVSKKFPEYKFIIAQAPGQPLELYQKMVKDYPNVDVALAGQTYLLLKISIAALVTSGTATLETALFGVPQVVCYKGSFISYQIAKRLVKVKYISLVNLIMDKEVVKELIQDELTVGNLERELNLILSDTKVRNRIQHDYAQLKSLLRQEEKASAKAARVVYQLALNPSEST